MPSSAEPRRARWLVGIGGLAGVAAWQRATARRGQATRGATARVQEEAIAAAGISPASGPPPIAVVIPSYNEAESIIGVLAELPAEVDHHPLEPIVVVDGGDDGTTDVVRAAGYQAVVHRTNLGQGAALRTGFAVARARRADVVVTMDADGQHRPDEIPRLVEPVLAGRADYVQGSRYSGRYDDAGGARDRGIRGFTWLINRVSGAGITDCTNGFRAIRVESLGRLRLEEDRFSAPELILESARQGLRIAEVPVHVRARARGQSKKPRRFGYPLGFLRVIVQVVRR